MIAELLTDIDFWKHASIPFVAAVVGWATNWVAIKLTFLPLEFRGLCRFLGWQGIIPSKAGKMAAIFAESTMFRLGTLGEIFRHMDPDKMAEHITSVIDPQVETYTDEVMYYGRNSKLWRALPSLVKSRIYDGVRGELPNLVRDLMEEVGDQVEDLVDFKHMLVTRLEGDKVLLNRLFLESGEEEFRFIVKSGFYFGFLFGLVQLAVWVFYKSWWVLPFFGGLVGYATNWIAINIIFRPQSDSGGPLDRAGSISQTSERGGWGVVPPGDPRDRLTATDYRGDVARSSIRDKPQLDQEAHPTGGR